MTAHRARPGLPLAHAGAGPARTAPAGAAAAAAAGRAGGSTPASAARPSAAAAAAPAASGRAMAACMELLPGHTLMHCIHTVLAGCSARVAPPAPPARPAGSPPDRPPHTLAVGPPAAAARRYIAATAGPDNWHAARIGPASGPGGTGSGWSAHISERSWFSGV